MPPPVILAASLRAVELFRDFDDAALALVAATAQERRLKAGQTLFLRGDPGDSMFVVASGKIRLSVATADGHVLALRHLGPGDAFGEVALLDGGERTADAAALNASVLLSIARGRFQSLVDQHPLMAKALIKGLCSRLRDTTDQLEAIALLPLEQRLARLLLHLAKAAKLTSRHATLELNISQGELAMLVGASRPKVNPILVGWHARGIALRTPQGLTLDTQMLHDIVDSDDE